MVFVDEGTSQEVVRMIFGAAVVVKRRLLFRLNPDSKYVQHQVFDCCKLHCGLQ